VLVCVNLEVIFPCGFRIGTPGFDVSPETYALASFDQIVVIVCDPKCRDVDISSGGEKVSHGVY
jgi:hypothetical protein